MPKNFALLKRSENQRISRRRLQESSSVSSTLSSGEDEKTELSTLDFSWKDQDWAPSLSAVFKILFSIRLSASVWSIISDCDEVYNYWEPLHLILFKRGFQTWEYSPIYAIRSWLYIILYAAPAKFLILFFPESKVALFFSLRFLISLFTLFSELVFYRAICQRISNSIGRTFILFSMFSSAMFGASCAFLPSSFSMALNAFASAFYLFEYWSFSIFCSAVSALLGWPFAAILGLPIVMEMLIIRRRKFATKFIIFTLLFGIFLCLLLFIVDTYFFGRPVLAPLNIVLYNVFSRNGPNLYGIEPISFYFRNLALNFNIVFILFILSIFLCLLFVFIQQTNIKYKKDDKPLLLNINYFENYSLKQWERFKPLFFLAMTAVLWMLIFMLQPHKEERFLFPIYPHICLLAAFCLDYLCRILNKTKFATKFYIAILIIFIITSFSRIAALHRNYSGLLDTYKEFNNKIFSSEFMLSKEKNNSTKMPVIRLCIGKEWHRFPSSFFLPENGRNNREIEMRFIRSEFRAILPDIFPKGLTISEITQKVPIHQNDENREQMERYVPLNSCNFLIDFAGMDPTEFEPDYSKMDGFQSIIQNRVLLSANSHPFFRAFYIPFTPDEFLKFGTMHVLHNKLNK